jgi:hypothetical protein
LPPEQDWGVPSAVLDDAEKRLAIRLPRALRELYERYGRLDAVWALQDRLVAPEAVRLEQDLLAIWLENQAVVAWGIRSSDLSAQDPPVVLRQYDRRTGLLVEADSTSTFALLFAAMNAKWSAAVKYRANGELTPGALAAIERVLPRLPFSDTHWPSFPSRLYGTDDLVVDVHCDTWLWVASLSESRLREIDAIVRSNGMSWVEITLSR